jgi:spore germination protein GerM
MRRLTLVLLVLGVLAGCGIPMDDAAVRVSGANLPPERAPAEATAKADVLTLYLVDGPILRAVARPEPGPLQARIRALLEGPRDTESADGLRSAIPPGTALNGASIVAGEAVVDFTDDFLTIVGEEHLLALAQVVFTATEVPGVVGVRFLVDGEAVPVARGDGQLAARPMTRDDYAAMAPA